MKTAAVIIDSWKLPIFERHLKEAGYSYDQRPGVIANTINLRVKYEWVAKLQPVIVAAQTECANTKGKH